MPATPNAYREYDFTDEYDDRPTAAELDERDEADADEDADRCGCSDRLCPCRGW